MKIEYDEPKRRQTLAERKLDFEDAAIVLDGVHLTRAVEERSGEARFFTLGILRGTVVALVWMSRGDATRIISMWVAHRSERKVYWDNVDRS